ncbi:MAG: anthranilate phosphoribosyltransferase [Acidobacteria bacterium]|nr:anthranilate phosphoribosyltransferase [Acidobacteriota bacterium]
MFAGVIEKLSRRQDLSADEAAGAMQEIRGGRASPAQISGLLVGLAMKGERPSEIVGIARTMRAHAVRVPGRFSPLLDLCGTGGDRAGTFNISSVAAVVAASTGVRVAKHGNRAVSSSCGSADLFEALGVRTAASPGTVARCLDQAGIAFLFAPAFHPSMRHAAPVRRELGFRTVFNLLGPLTNPASPTHQLVGVPRPELTELVARSLVALGSERAWVVHGADGLDEISTTGYSKVSECREGTVGTFYVHPSDFGLPVSTRAALAGGSVGANADIAKAILEGAHGPARDIVVLNAGAALFIAGRAASIREGIALAESAIDCGAAMGTLENLVKLSQAGDGAEPQ